MSYSQMAQLELMNALNNITSEAELKSSVIWWQTTLPKKLRRPLMRFGIMAASMRTP